MRKPSKPFVFGCLTGIVIGPVGLLAALMAVALLFPDLVVKQKAKELKAPSITAGMMANYDWQLEKREGGTVSLDTLEGKPIFLHLWNPSCVHCLAELPSIEAIYHQASAMGVEFVCVALGEIEDLDSVIESNGYLFPAYTAPVKRPAPYDSAKIPSTFVIGRDGDVVLRHNGSAKWDDPSVAALLAALSTAPAENGE